MVPIRARRAGVDPRSAVQRWRGDGTTRTFRQCVLVARNPGLVIVSSVSDDREESSPLLAAVHHLRGIVGEATLPLDIPDTAQANVNRVALLQQLDDYVIPRLSSLDAPLLAVVGGSTGAGKSTLVNSIVRADVSRSGVLRPTTTSPVLVHHPDDEKWFLGTRILPGLSRVTGVDTGEPHPGTVRLVTAEALPEGMALLDAPDIDSVVSANRALARQLLLAADLWLFVTTAARYADAVPWDLLKQASDRGTSLAIVLDRVPPDALAEVRPHLAGMLREQGLSTAPIFTIPETPLTPEGWLPDKTFERLESWLVALAGDARARGIVVRQTLDGAVASLEPRTRELIAASRAQQHATTRLKAAADGHYVEAFEGVERGMTDGTLLRGEVLARWQEFVGTGEFFRQVETTISRLRDRVMALIKGQQAPAQEVGEALQTGVAALVAAQAQLASSGTVRAWRWLPGGESLLARHPELAKPAPDLSDRIERMVRDWQGEVLDLVRTEGADRRTDARIAAYGVNGIGLFLMLVTFAHTAGLSGAEVGIAGGTAVLAQRVLEAIFGDQAVREMSAKARKLLLAHVQDLFGAEQGRYEHAVEQVDVGRDQATVLETALAAVRAAR
jgi:energy-coupling factor transporter ATP-binding protein EcfA2